MQNSSQNGLPGFGAQQLPTATTKAIAFVRSLSGSAILLAGGVFVLQATMGDGHRPSDVIGGFHGNTNTAQLDAERNAQTRTAESVANAQAKAQAQWAMEVETARQQQQAILESLRAKQDAANWADYICMSGPVSTAFFGRDAAAYAQVAHDACGEAARLRHEITEAQAEASRIGSAIMQRPVPITNQPR
jgi:hypothetical protein